MLLLMTKFHHWEVALAYTYAKQFNVHYFLIADQLRRPIAGQSLCANEIPMNKFISAGIDDDGVKEGRSRDEVG